jgi:hypothetical protein
VPLGHNSQPHQDYDFMTGLFADQLNIIIDTTGLGGANDNIGLDNIQFGQIIPEPATYTMLLLGGASLWFAVAHNRRKQRVKRSS